MSYSVHRLWFTKHIRMRLSFVAVMVTSESLGGRQQVTRWWTKEMCRGLHQFGVERDSNQSPRVILGQLQHWCDAIEMAHTPHGLGHDCYCRFWLEVRTSVRRPHLTDASLMGGRAGKADNGKPAALQ